MFRKVAVIILVLAIIASLVVGYIYIKNQRMPNFDAIQAVPIEAAIIIKSQDVINKLTQLRTTNEIWTELLQLPAFNKFDSDILFINDFANHYPTIFDALNNREILVSLHKLGSNRVGSLFIVPLISNREKKVLLDIFVEKVGLTQQIQKINFEKLRI